MVKRYVTVASEQVAIQHGRLSPMDRMSVGRLKQREELFISLMER